MNELSSSIVWWAFLDSKQPDGVVLQDYIPNSTAFLLLENAQANHASLRSGIGLVVYVGKK